MTSAFNVGESRGIISTPLAGEPVRYAPIRPITSFSVVIPDDNGQPMVSIHPDRRIEFGENYVPDEAARAFWDMIQSFAPDPAVQEFGAPLKARIDKELARGEEAVGLLREALAMYEGVIVGKVDGNAIGTLAAKIRGFLNTPEPS